MRCDMRGKRCVGHFVVSIEVRYIVEAGKKGKTVKTRPR